MVIGPIASITHINFHLFFSELTLVSWLKVSELKTGSYDQRECSESPKGVVKV